MLTGKRTERDEDSDSDFLYSTQRKQQWKSTRIVDLSDDDIDYGSPAATGFELHCDTSEDERNIIEDIVPIEISDNSGDDSDDSDIVFTIPKLLSGRTTSNTIISCTSSDDSSSDCSSDDDLMYLLESDTASDDDTDGDDEYRPYKSLKPAKTVKPQKTQKSQKSQKSRRKPQKPQHPKKDHAATKDG
ncbi:hypothetical protein GQ42DRAFT_153786 [Ramicandelaber brevisporus]|nr:hypothetical protein GQ42DRAFT_153786 [Ramicandelaber brevisporus]